MVWSEVILIVNIHFTFLSILNGSVYCVFQSRGTSPAQDKPGEGQPGEQRAFHSITNFEDPAFVKVITFCNQASGLIRCLCGLSSSYHPPSTLRFFWGFMISRLQVAEVRETA